MSSRTVLFYYAYSQGFTGGPRTLLDLVSLLDHDELRPFVVTQKQSPLTDALADAGIAHQILPIPSALGRGRGHLLRAGLGERLLTGPALVRYTARLVDLAKREHVGCFWARNIKGVALTAPAALWLRLPLVWDIGMEPESKGLVRGLHLAGLAAASVVTTQGQSQPSFIFGDRVARVFAGKMRAIVPGVRLDRRARLSGARRSDDGVTRILSVGTVHPRKNQRALLRAVGSLAGRYPDLRIDLAGPVADERYRQELERVAAVAGLGQRVRFLGWVDDVAERMLEADVLVQCADNEGVPHVIREAMFAGLPIVATAVGGVPDVVRDGQTGILVEAGAEPALAAAIDCCLSDNALCERLSKSARSYAADHLRQERWAHEYGQLVSGLCENRA